MLKHITSTSCTRYGSWLIENGSLQVVVSTPICRGSSCFTNQRFVVSESVNTIIGRWLPLCPVHSTSAQQVEVWSLQKCLYGKELMLLVSKAGRNSAFFEMCRMPSSVLCRCVCGLCLQIVSSSPFTRELAGSEGKKAKGKRGTITVRCILLTHHFHFLN